VDQLAVQIHRAQQLFERRPLAGCVGDVDILGQSDAQSPGGDGHLGDIAVLAALGLDS